MPDRLSSLEVPLLTRMHALMVQTRVLEERLITMNKNGDGFFWIGGPGEEAWSVPLGMQIKKGRGVEYDYLHFHYRASGTALALGVDAGDVLRQMRSVATDPFSKGRNFVNHFAIPEWNLLPVTPTIETQYAIAIGTAIAQARVSSDGVTIVGGGDAGTAEGDFHSCLVWANRPTLPLPILITVVNNGFGISTPMREEHGERNISDWGRVFDMPAKTVDGNDPIESWFAIKEALAYCRSTRRPYLLEARCSRLYGHSSSSGANRIPERDCVADFEKRLVDGRILRALDVERAWEEARDTTDRAYAQIKAEPYPRPESIWEDVFASGLPDSWPRTGGS